MNVNILVKLNFLILGLCLCGYAMYCLKNDGLPQSVGGLFGLSGDNSYLTWCDTRAEKLVVDDAITLFQKNKNWYAKIGQQETKLNTIAIEKWFSNYCRLTVQFTKDSPIGTMYSNILGIQFIGGSQASFKKSTSINLFKWKDRYFQSAQLQMAIKDLKKIIK